MNLFLLLSLFAVDPRYHNFDSTAAELGRIAAQYPTLCRLDTIGFSTTNHWPLFCLKVSDHPDREEDEPHILYNGVHHACELIGDEICLYMAHDLLGRYDTSAQVRRWVDSNQIYIVPLVNPDGHEINMRNLDTIWRKNIHNFHHDTVFDPDSDGVDLNRNYGFLWQTGDPTLGSRYYRGESAFSENETQAIRDLSLQERFMFDICWHSSISSSQGQEVYWPWRWGNSWCPDYPEIMRVADTVAQRIINDAGDGSYAPVYGRSDDGAVARNWLYYALGTFAYTIEVSTCYQPPGYRVDSICRRVLQGAYYLLDRAHGSSITGHVTDLATGLPLVAQVTVLQATSSPDTIQPRRSDSLYGRYWHLLGSGTYTLQVSKSGYYPEQIDSIQVRPGIPTIVNVALSRNSGVQEELPALASRLALDVGRQPCISQPVRISYEIPAGGAVRLDIFDQTGRRVKELGNRWAQPGTYGASWDGLTDKGTRASTGVYFVRLTCGKQGITRKLVLTGG